MNEFFTIYEAMKHMRAEHADLLADKGIAEGKTSVELLDELNKRHNLAHNPNIVVGEMSEVDRLIRISNTLTAWKNLGGC